ncbi:MAG: hypothetical protein OEZ22_14990 [Spirochaetia bacterium]|nr:hypothetical protein [Spirochaetia bacterium]
MSLNKNIFFLKLIILFIISSFNYIFAQEMDVYLESIQKYFANKNDYPELFKDNPYRLNITDVSIGDLDSDNQKEVVIAVKPHFRQSPTVIIFKVDKQMKLKRVIEGLAPGSLQKISGDYLDSHTTGLATDIKLSTGKEKHIITKENDKERLNVIKIFGGVVQYRNWYHVDKRSGKGLYIDMRHINLENNMDNCINFEFSTVKDIEILPDKDNSGNSLHVWVDDKIYVYKIQKFLNNGLLEKTLKIFPLKN